MVDGVRFWPVAATVALSLVVVGASTGLASAAVPAASPTAQTCKEQNKAKVKDGGATGYDYVSGAGGQFIPVKFWAAGTCLSSAGHTQGRYVKYKDRWVPSPGFQGEYKYFYKAAGESFSGKAIYFDGDDIIWPSNQ